MQSLLMSQTEVTLREFDPTTVGDNRICIFIGRRGSGKSTGMRAMLYHKRHIPSGVCMSETEESNKFWCQSVPGSHIFGEYNSDAVLDMINEQRKQHRLTTNKSLHEPIFWVAEDVMGSGELKNCKQAARVFMNGRQWQIFCLLALQYVTDLPPKFRGQVDYVFAYRALSLDDREKLFSYFFSGAFESYSDFVQVLRACTSDYNCLVLDATKPTNKLDEQIFWWKAPEVPQFKAGCPEYWQFHMEKFKGEDEEDEGFSSTLSKHKRILVKMTK